MRDFCFSIILRETKKSKHFKCLQPRMSVIKLLLMVIHVSRKCYPIKPDKYLHFKLECFNDDSGGATHVCLFVHIYSQYSVA